MKDINQVVQIVKHSQGCQSIWLRKRLNMKRYGFDVLRAECEESGRIIVLNINGKTHWYTPDYMRENDIEKVEPEERAKPTQTKTQAESDGLKDRVKLIDKLWTRPGLA